MAVNEVELFIPCFVDQLYPQSAFNLIKVLERLGVTVRYNAEQTCCGQPAFNAGFWDDAKQVGEKFLEDFNGQKPVVIMSSSCTGMVRNYYYDLFQNSAQHNKWKTLRKNTWEAGEYIYKFTPWTNLQARFPHKVTYHDSCSALRECHLKKEPREILARVEGLELVEMENVETCCGFGGTFAVKFEPIAVGMTEQKVQNALATGAEYLVSSDWSCMMEIDSYVKKHNLNLKVIHLADVLASGW